MGKYQKRILLTTISIFLLAFGIRIINLEIIKDNPFFDYPIMDEKYHDEWAEEISQGHLLERVPFYRAPTYSYFLAFIYVIFGHEYYIARLIGIIIGSFSCILIYLIGKALFSHKVGMLSAFLACIYGMFLYFDSMLLTVNLEIFFALFGMLWILKWLKDSENKNVVLAGLFWGLASITRPNFFIFIVVFVIFVLIDFKQKPLRNRFLPIILFIAGMIFIVLPVLLINIIVGKDSVLIAWNGGINFYLGNNSFASGWTATSPKLDITWWGGYKDAIIVAEKALNKRLSPSQISHYWFHCGLNYIFSEPFNWIILMIKKVYLLFNSFELPNNQSIQTFKTFSPLLRYSIVNYGTIIALAIWGFATSVRKNLRIVHLFLAVYALSIVTFFVTARYRMPLVPFMLIFTAHAVFWFVQKFKERRWTQIIPAIILIAITTVLVHTDFYGTHIDKVNRSEIYAAYGHKFFEVRDYNRSISEYNKALAYDSKNLKTFNALGVTFIVLGQYDEAREMFYESLRIRENSDAYFKLGLINFEEEKLDSAQFYFAAALKIDSTNPEIYYYYGISLSFDEKPHLAIEHLENSLKYYPHTRYTNNIHYNLGLLYMDLGDMGKAKQHLVQVDSAYMNVRQLLKNLR